MKAVNDSAVVAYAARIKAGEPLGTLFPAKMSECDFTDEQRQIIRRARAERRRDLTKMKDRSVVQPKPKQLSASPAGDVVVAPVQTKPKALTKLRKMLYLQSGRCFFCGEPLREQDASIEHLNPRSRGGTNTEDNEVVCHASLNETFGALDVKRKFEFVIKSAGAFRCPGK